MLPPAETRVLCVSPTISMIRGYAFELLPSTRTTTCGEVSGGYITDSSICTSFVDFEGSRLGRGPSPQCDDNGR